MKKEIKEENIINFNNLYQKYPKSVIVVNKGYPPYIENEPPYFGFQGINLEDIIENKIQCNICGKWFKSISYNHLKKDYNLGLWDGETLNDYRDKFGFLRRTKFNSREVQEKLIKCKNTEEQKKHFRSVASINWKKDKKIPPRKTNGQQKAEYKNKVMCCEKQIIYRILEDVKRLGRTPKARECSVYSVAERTFGSWNNALKIAGLSINLRFRYSDNELKEYWNNFVKEFKRKPKWSDFRKHNLPSRSVYSSHFGNNYAKIL